MKTIAISITLLAAAILSGCASTPSAPISAGDYCKGQARMAAARASMADRTPLAGDASENIADTVYKDCLTKVTK